ncbi:SHOCT domain-containing protein [Caenimonas sp. SL110]|uniref:SHOCT domain-containing protein n=1 Tax=Caenimonas sp. SL110 TaxID=1450524 RepID=UPI000652C4FB|nr:SHOCT domain-containing protein [Caenimonas sp. SL110]
MTTSLKTFVALLVGLPFAALATDFDRLTVGQELADDAISVGNFRIQLPAPGRWTVVSKQAVQAGRDTASWDQPVRQTIAVAQSAGGELSAVFIFTAPEKPYGNRWSDEPCAEVNDFIVKDKMNSTFMMPECFAVQRHRTEVFRNAAAGGAFPDVVNWVAKSRLTWPDQFTRVFYTKFYRGGYVRANLYLAGTHESMPWIESWGRQLASSISAGVTQQTKVATVSPMPGVLVAPDERVRPKIPSSSQTAKSAESRIRELKSLFEKGLITKEDYEGKRTKILEDL